MFLNPRRPGRSQLTGAGRATTWQRQVGDRMAGQPELDIAAMISQQVPFRSVAPTRSYGRFGLGDRFSGPGPGPGPHDQAPQQAHLQQQPAPAWPAALPARRPGTSPASHRQSTGAGQRPHSCPRKGLGDTRSVEVTLQVLFGLLGEQIKKYSTAKAGLMNGIFLFTHIWAAPRALRPGSCCRQLCPTGKDLSMLK